MTALVLDFSSGMSIPTSWKSNKNHEIVTHEVDKWWISRFLNESFTGRPNENFSLKCGWLDKFNPEKYLTLGPLSFFTQCGWLDETSVNETDTLHALLQTFNWPIDE